MQLPNNVALAEDPLDTARRSRFDRLCGSFRTDLLRFSFCLTRDQSLAEDVVQETLLRAWKHLDALQNDVAARGWLLTIARREVARKFQRKNIKTMDIEGLSAADEAAALACHATPDVFEVRKAIWSLPLEYREPLMLQVMLGFTTREIADRMGATRAAILSRLFRARHKLRESLGPRPERRED